MSEYGTTRRLLLLLSYVTWAMNAQTAQQVYKLSVNGFACPFYAYDGIEKKT